MSQFLSQCSRQCNSSYAFSAVGALEGAWALSSGSLTRLSEQNIIDCSGIDCSGIVCWERIQFATCMTKDILGTQNRKWIIPWFYIKQLYVTVKHTVHTCEHFTE